MRRNRILAMFGVAGAVAITGTVVPIVIANSQDPILPDLESTAPPVWSAYLMDASVDLEPGMPGNGAQNLLLLRFDGWVYNKGPGVLEFEGTPKDRNVRQRVQVNPLAANCDNAADCVPAGVAAPDYSGPLNNDAEGDPACVTPTPSANPGSGLPAKPTSGPCFIYSTTDSMRASDGHNHWHMVGAAEYSLWNEAGTAPVRDGQKVGFCLEDSHPYDDNTDESQRHFGQAPGTSDFCNQYERTGNQPLREGITSGFYDRYHSALAWQWLDVSDIAPGKYRLGGRVDPFNRIWEADKSNNTVKIADPKDAVTIPGFSPVAPAPATTSRGAAVPITLGSRTFTFTCPPNNLPECINSPLQKPVLANRRFSITQMPQHGTLTVSGQPVAVGQQFTSNTVTYTPKPGVGNVTDTFRFGVRDAASAYPRNPPTAAVNVQVGRPSATVTIAEAPAEVTAGTQVQLNAQALNADDDTIEWSVDGAPEAGTITDTGVYRAPETIPAGEIVTIRAALAGDRNVADAVQVRIVAAAKGSIPVPAVPPTVESPAPITVLPTPTRTATTPAPAQTASAQPPLPAPSLGDPWVSRVGNRVIVRTVPNRSGRMTVQVFRGSKRVHTCTFRRATAHRAALCRVPAGRVGPLRKARVVITQRVDDARPARTIRMTVRGQQRLAAPNLGRPVLARIGNRVIVRTVPNRSGRMTVQVFRGSKRVHTCTFRRATAHRAALCYVPAGRPGSLRGARVVITQRVDDTRPARTIRTTLRRARI